MQAVAAIFRHPQGLKPDHRNQLLKKKNREPFQGGYMYLFFFGGGGWEKIQKGIFLEILLVVGCWSKKNECVSVYVYQVLPEKSWILGECSMN